MTNFNQIRKKLPLESMILGLLSIFCAVIFGREISLFGLSPKFFEALASVYAIEMCLFFSVWLHTKDKEELPSWLLWLSLVICIIVSFIVRNAVYGPTI